MPTIGFQCSIRNSIFLVPGSACAYLIFLTGTTGGARVKNMSGVNFSRLNAKKLQIFPFWGYLL